MPAPHPALKPGARIGVCAPSSRLNPETFDAGLAVLKAAGYDVFVHPQCRQNFGQMAGGAALRADAFLDLLTDDRIDAIVFSGGGHRGAELLSLIDWNRLKTVTAKPVMGFSDNTVILNALSARLGWTTFFGPTLQTIGRTKTTHPESWTHSESVLRGEGFTHFLDYAGSAVEGKLVCATLALLPVLLGTNDMPDLKGAILCIEDVHEELSSIDRNLLILKRHGVFDHIAALVCGEFKDTLDTGRPFGFTLNEIVRHHAGPDLPIAFNAPFGHGDRIYALPIGAPARLENGTLKSL